MLPLQSRICHPKAELFEEVEDDGLFTQGWNHILGQA